ncbi:hypothetical protein A1O3_04767 [Capronia epimyces CBS 606.96]|uniref:Uncharacterized protein n=1 Tax=Capronia epimyces CBS 606.96 TaxID=1182542 RepID=W9Y384_9EURO|nr:uncharacterized protein A1O3_04767 [Capronia epimyces CBS 606.96]EXJ84100.1 hypothetical protein A1O3_04767 [Capronia epimyces CBS 606.96]
MSLPSCRTKVALFEGCRPSLSTPQQIAATQDFLSSACSTSCIYCDIWKLATLIASHVPLSARYDLYTGTPVNSPNSSAPSSPATSSPISRSRSRSISYHQLISASKKIEAQFQAQRSRLNSILSICIVSGADQTEGLRMAHDRCSDAVEDLLDQEEDLEECLLRDLLESQEDTYDSDSDYDYTQFGYAVPPDYYQQERRPSLIDVTH